MLRASATHTGRPVDLAAITDDSRDPLLPHGRALLHFVDAIVSTDADRIALARTELDEVAGRAATVRAAAVAANFQMMNRLVDATGVPIGASMRAIAVDLGLEPDRGRDATGRPPPTQR